MPRTRRAAKPASPVTPTEADLGPGSPARLGVHLVGDGANVAVFSENAARIDLCLFDPDGTETAQLPLPEQTGPVWHGHIPGLAEGQLYGLRAHGAYAPERGHRFNHHKLLVDPYARRLAGRVVEADALYAHDQRDPEGDLSFDARDSAPFVPKGVITTAGEYAHRPPRPRRPWGETVIYEAHLKGLTRLMPGIPPGVAGTWEALGQDAVIAHLTRLGITAIELLPVQAFVDDAFLLNRGLRNYWGYNTLAFFAPAPRYLGPSGEAGVLAAIDRLHEAGIEVILDVVYNHTAEGGAMGPTLSFRGLDNASYYRLMPDDPRAYVNDTGCGNTVNAAHPFVLRMVLDSLRHWVEHYRIDGFRFDLATSLAREPAGFDPEGGFLDALRQDPVLADVKLIMEPWDIGPGGYQLGQFPPGMAEWSDRYRDDVRRFWRGDEGATSAVAARLLGSADIFERAGRPAWSSVNLITAHDGFTLADLTAFNGKHNQANGEKNRDGHGANYSDNMGAEGETEDAKINAARARRRRALLATMFLSQGTPMLLAGDELANGQGGNNNAYCQDNVTGWIDWDSHDETLADAVAAFARLRRALPVLRQTRFLHGQIRAEDEAPDVVWQSLDGGTPAWDDPALSGFALRIRGAAEAPAGAKVEGDALIAVSRAAKEATLKLPTPPHGSIWVRVLDTAVDPVDAETEEAGEVAVIEAGSIVVFVPRRASE
ncbi:MAG: glycogen debranching protein GlgX [Pseudomonadota bacterium]